MGRKIGQLLQIYGGAAVVVGISLAFRTPPGAMILAGATLITIGILMSLGFSRPSEREEV